MTGSLKVVKVAIVGLGRIGKYHAMNIVERVANVQLVAGCSIVKDDLVWAEEKLAPYGVALYDSFEKMLEHPDIEAILVASTSSTHAHQTITAIERGFHVMCEKPLATTVEDAQRVADAAAAHPNLKVMCGFSRRYDDSYADAHEKVASGLIGKPTVFRSQTCDKQDPSGFFVQFAKNSGGIFVDCSIHDLDLCQFFYGPDAKPESMSAVGNCSVYPDLAKYDDCDNAMAIIKFHDGRIANFYASRMMSHGQDDYTEIIGTEGKITVNKNPRKNLTTICDSNGIRNEVPTDFYGRFEYAFVNEMNSFARYVLEDIKVPSSLQANVEVLKWGKTLQECLISGKTARFDKNGKRLADI